MDSALARHELEMVVTLLTEGIDELDGDKFIAGEATRVRLPE